MLVKVVIFIIDLVSNGKLFYEVKFILILSLFVLEYMMWVFIEILFKILIVVNNRNIY